MRAARLAAIAVLGIACDANVPGEQAPAASGSPQASPSLSVPAREPAGYADPGSCGACHPAEQAAWHGSHHDRAMEPATEASVLGDFDDAAFTQFGRTTHFRRRAGRYFVETEGPDGEPTEYEVAYTFGVEPLQQYLIAFPRGRLQSLAIAWDTTRGEWFSLYPDENITARDPLHWTGPLQRWNSMCADCHSTAFARGYDVAADAYETDWISVDVSCEACHGPAGDHMRWAEGLTPGEVVAPQADRRLSAALGTAVREVETCAPCHARRHAVSARAVPGEPLLDHWAPELLRPDLYHADGQIDAEVYVYGSFVQSKMYQRGVRCSDCHEPHSLTLRAAGNDLCTRCHSPEANTRFPTLAHRVYDAPEHHFHAQGSAGAECVACHMPAKTYMQVDPRRDHSLRVPRPDLTVRIGTPNACSGCHRDRDAGWAADFLAARLLERSLTDPSLKNPALEQHWGEAIAAGRAGDPDAVTRLRALAGDVDAPAIARATAIEMLAGRFGDAAGLSLLSGAVGDADPLVRAAAARSLEYVDPGAGNPLLATLLRDERRAVRVEAARVLSGAPPGALSDADREAFANALDEYRDAQRALGDTPEAHLNLGVLAGRRGLSTAAEAAYRTAIRLQPDFVPARVNLANLLNGQTRNEEAEIELRAALASAERLAAATPTTDLESAPDPALRAGVGEIHYSLGLLLAEVGRLDESADALGRGAALLATRPRAHYNHGIALQRLGRVAEAEAALSRAEALAPDDPSFQHALAVLYAQTGRRDEALAHARRVVALTGGAPGTRELVSQIEAMPATP